jgi:hypothetical protein
MTPDHPPWQRTPPGRRLRSGVHDYAVGCDAHRDRSPSRRRGRREGEDRAGREDAGGADRQDCPGEDGTPNSHDDLHASTEVDSLPSWSWRPRPARLTAPIIASLRLITESSVRLS